MLVNHLPSEKVERPEDSTNEEIVNAVMKGVGAGEERGHGAMLLEGWFTHMP